MKTIITILFMFSFALQGQIQLSEDWSFRPDKVKHSIGAGVVSSCVFLPVAHKTGDIDLAFRASWIASGFAALGKEFADGMQGKEISFADMGYTILSGVITAYVFRAVAKRRKKKWNEKFNIEF